MEKEILGALGTGVIAGGLITYTSYKNSIVKNIETLKATTEENNKLKEEYKILEELIEEVTTEKEALEKEAVKKVDYENLLTEANKIIAVANEDQLQIKEAIEGILNAVEDEVEVPVVETIKEAVEEAVATVEALEINEDTLKLTIEEIEANRTTTEEDEE